VNEADSAAAQQPFGAFQAISKKHQPVPAEPILFVGFSRLASKSNGQYSLQVLIAAFKI